MLIVVRGWWLNLLRRRFEWGLRMRVSGERDVFGGGDLDGMARDFWTLIVNIQCK